LKTSNKRSVVLYISVLQLIVFLVLIVFLLFFVVGLLVGGFAAAVEDVDDDGGTNKGGDAVDGHGTLKARGAGNQVTDQGQGGTIYSVLNR